MKRPHDALRLDVQAFITDGQPLAGSWPGASLTRLAELQTPPQDGGLAAVDWTAQGRRLPVPAGEAELWLDLQARASVWLTCQRCLQPFTEPLALARSIRFVRGEAAAEALDAEIEDDVLALSKALDLRELVEDELLLALPIVPRHQACPQPLPVPVDAAAPPEDVPERPNPFAALQQLKTKPGSRG